MLRRPALLGLLLSVSALAGCECDRPGDPDAGDAATDAGMFDGDLPDAGTDGGMGGGPLFPPPVITTCPGDALPPPASGRCEVMAGTSGTLFTGDVLTPGEVFRGGQVLVGDDGVIDCVGCDCSGEPGADTATEIVCPDVVISPGLINAHDHVTFAGGWPYGDTRAGMTDRMTEERYEQRHDWRSPRRNHTRIPAAGGMSSTGKMQWLELRQLMSGTTSVFGSGGTGGFIRNLDSDANDDLPSDAATYETFPLDDGDGTQLESGCAYPYAVDPMSSCGGEICNFNAADTAAYVAHVSEGIDAVAHNEFLCLREGAADIAIPRSAFIHGVGLLPADIAEMAEEGVELIWSPRTNITLYGDTARVTEYAYAGATIALGTDWINTGSMNMLRELACADAFNQNHLDQFFPDEQLWLMATRNSAIALGVDGSLGTIAVGRVADLALYDASVDRDHRAVIGAEADDVVLVTIGGEVRFGDAALVDSLVSGCEPVGDVCGEEKRACVSDFSCFDDCTSSMSTPMPCTWALLNVCGADQYPLFFCGVDPVDEPSCVPERNSMGPLPDAMVNGSNYYTGMSSADDMDGDGILDANDNCATIFNPIRPLDNGAQGNVDADALGDACDPCPFDADTTACSSVDPNDRDGDGVIDTMDNCPGVANPAPQTDTDGDGSGDPCDACPMDANPGGSACPGTIYEVKQGDIALGQRVRLVQSVVTAVATNGFTMQVPTDHPEYAGENFSGIFVFTSGAPTLMGGAAITRGMTVDVDGVVGEFPTTGTARQIQIGGTPTITMSAASSAIPAPIVVAPAEIDTSGARALALEAVLVRVETVTVTNPMPPMTGTSPAMNEFEVDNILRVDDRFFAITPFVTMGETFDSITGVLLLSSNRHKLMPRDAVDYVAGAPQLAAFGPGLTYARAGAGSASTFPSALTVTLTRNVTTNTPVTITTSATAAELVVSNVTVTTGTNSVAVPVDGRTPGTYIVTATLGTRMMMAMVRVLAADEQPASFMLTPDTANVRVDGTFTFTLTTDIPAPPSGAMFTIVEDTGGTVPASVMIGANAISTTFDYTAPSSPATGTLTATLVGPGVMQSAAITVSAGPPPTIVINEIDYDNPGTDTAEFVELFNPGASPIPLANLQLVLVNGSSTPGAIYQMFNLSTAGTELPGGGYLVVRSPGLTVAAGALTIDLPGSSAVQNEGTTGDGAVVWNTSTREVLDAFSYGPTAVSVVLSGTTVNLVEGTRETSEDSSTAGTSLARLPNGSDSGDAATDWAPACSTPGAANLMTCP